MIDVLRVIIVLGVLFVSLSLAAGLIWLERRLLALWQDRYGPNRVGPFGLLQVLADMIKIFTKEDWIPPFADRSVFVLAPAIVMVSVLMSFAVLPVTATILVVDLNIALLFFLGMSSLGVYSVVLAGWASDNKYALLGGLRASAQMLSYEVFMGLSVMGVVLLAGSFDLRAIVEAQHRVWFVVPQFLGFVLFLIAGLAEMRRIPFDLPEAENELVAGYHTEYSGMKFALFFMAEYIKIIAVSMIFTTLFLGGYYLPFQDAIEHFCAGVPWLTWFNSVLPYLGPLVLFIKVALVLFVFIWVRATLPRIRYDRLMSFGWKVTFPLALLSALVTAVVVLLVGG